MSERKTPVNPRDELLEWALSLPLDDRYWIYDQLGEQLTDRPDEPSRVSEEVREQREALDAMQTVAGHLGLAKGVAPTSTQYRAAAKELGEKLKMDANGVQRAWGLWNFARDAYEDRGARMPEAVRERLSRGNKGQSRTRAPEAYLRCLRRWVESEGFDPSRTSRAAYDRFAEQYNANNLTGFYMSTSAALFEGLGLWWRDIVAVAHGEYDLDEARRRTRKRRKDRSAPINREWLGIRQIGRAFKVSRPTAQRWTSDPTFPTPYIEINGIDRWLLSEIRAWRRRKPLPPRPPVPDLMFRDELAKRLRVKPTTLSTDVSRRNWRRVPRPAGFVGRDYYWARSETEAWLQAREERRREKAGT
ncbi:MAG: hypothetical protein WKF94_04320 [Solirubrobacteraceae bacterium]